VHVHVLLCLLLASRQTSPIGPALRKILATKVGKYSTVFHGGYRYLRHTTLWSIRKVTALSLCGTPERGFDSGKSSLNGSDSHIHFVVLSNPGCLLGAGEKNKKGTFIKMTLSGLTGTHLPPPKS